MFTDFTVVLILNVLLFPEELQDMKKQMKSLQDKNNTYMQQTISMEEVRFYYFYLFLFDSFLKKFSIYIFSIYIYILNDIDLIIISGTLNVNS